MTGVVVKLARQLAIIQQRVDKVSISNPLSAFNQMDNVIRTDKIGYKVVDDSQHTNTDNSPLQSPLLPHAQTYTNRTLPSIYQNI